MRRTISPRAVGFSCAAWRRVAMHRVAASVPERVCLSSAANDAPALSFACLKVRSRRMASARLPPSIRVQDHIATGRRDFYKAHLPRRRLEAFIPAPPAKSCYTLTAAKTGPGQPGPWLPGSLSGLAGWLRLLAGCLLLAVRRSS